MMFAPIPFDLVRARASALPSSRMDLARPARVRSIQRIPPRQMPRPIPRYAAYPPCAALGLRLAVARRRHLASLSPSRGLVKFDHVSVAPLVLSGAATGAVEAARRRGTVVPGAYALGRLLAESGVLDAGVLRLGADVTAVAILREGRVVATRAFGLGRIAIASRPDRLEADARVWADCVVASLHTLDGLPPARWLFVGFPARSCRSASWARPLAASAGPGGRVASFVASRPSYGCELRLRTVAVGAAAIASGIFAA